MVTEPTKIVSLDKVKDERKRRQYAGLVLKAYDDIERAERREFLDHKAAVENASRQKL